MTYFNVLNLIVQECTTTMNGSSDVIEKRNIFVFYTFIEKFSHASIVRELSLIRKLHVILIACVNPLVCWHNHDNQIPNFDFLAKWILKILEL
jgi:hypothetical protein